MKDLIFGETERLKQRQRYREKGGQREYRDKRHVQAHRHGHTCERSSSPRIQTHSHTEAQKKVR